MGDQLLRPRTLQSWLSDLGIKPEFATRDTIARAQQDLEKYQIDKRLETEKLFQGAASTSEQSRMLVGLRSCPSEIKTVAYSQALRLSRDENLIFALVALGDESVDVLRACTPYLPASSIRDNFCAYLKTRAVECSGIEMSASPTHSDPTNSERLLRTISQRTLELKQSLAETSAKDIGVLVKHVERLFPILPHEGFGEFIRQQMTSFACLAAPNSQIADNVLSMFTRDKDLEKADLIPFIGADRAARILSTLASVEEPAEPILTAAFLDSLRTDYPEALSHVSVRLAGLCKSRNPALSLSAQAASLQLGISDEETFQKTLLKALRADKKGIAASWLARNPDLLDLVPLHKLSPRLFAKILGAIATTHPKSALQFLQTGPQHHLDIADPRSWHTVVEALSKINDPSSNELFVEQVVRILDSKREGVGQLLQREPALSLLSRNIWAISERVPGETEWHILFDALKPKTNETSVLSWLTATPHGHNELLDWIKDIYIPELFESGTLSTRFLVQLQDNKLKESIASRLCAATLSRVRDLQAMAEEWPKTRSALKHRLARKLFTGLRIASRAGLNNEKIRAKLADVENSIRSWEIDDSPRLDPEIASAAKPRSPEARAESEEFLGAFFSRRLENPHEVSYMFAENPWALAAYLARPKADWPKVDLIFEQIIKSLVYFARLDNRARNAWQALEEEVKIELGVTLRESLSDIEEMIAGFFIFRSMLHEIGLEEAESGLGCVVKPEQLSSERHKFVRDPLQQGRLRLFGLGIKIRDRVIGNARVEKSGDENDRD